MKYVKTKRVALVAAVMAVLLLFTACESDRGLKTTKVYENIFSTVTDIDKLAQIADEMAKVQEPDAARWKEQFFPDTFTILGFDSFIFNAAPIAAEAGTFIDNNNIVSLKSYSAETVSDKIKDGVRQLELKASAVLLDASGGEHTYTAPSVTLTIENVNGKYLITRVKV